MAGAYKSYKFSPKKNLKFLDTAKNACETKNGIHNKRSMINNTLKHFSQKPNIKNLEYLEF